MPQGQEKGGTGRGQGSPEERRERMERGEKEEREEERMERGEKWRS